MDFNFNLNVKLSLDDDLMRIIRNILKEGIKMAESPEVVAFRARVESALNSVSDSLNSQSESLANIVADIKRLIDGGISGLTPEDKAALEAVGSAIENAATGVSASAQAISEAAGIVPEP